MVAMQNQQKNKNMLLEQTARVPTQFILNFLARLCDEVLVLEAEQNQRVYGLFGLSEDEVNIVEGEKR